MTRTWTFRALEFSKNRLTCPISAFHGKASPTASILAVLADLHRVSKLSIAINEQSLQSEAISQVLITQPASNSTSVQLVNVNWDGLE
jgi:hypothetical protein